MAISEITCVYTPPGSPIIVLPDIDLTGTDSDAEVSLDASPTFHEKDIVLDAFEKISAETQKENTEFLTAWPHNTGDANPIEVLIQLTYFRQRKPLRCLFGMMWRKAEQDILHSCVVRALGLLYSSLLMKIMNRIPA
jgi:hypothetical protein